MRCGILHIKK